jgi:hypothetical protein
MYVYLAFVDVEINLPQAVLATPKDDILEFVDEAGQVVAVFPVDSVVMFSRTRSYKGNQLSSDGASAASPASTYL